MTTSAPLPPEQHPAPAPAGDTGEPRPYGAPTAVIAGAAVFALAGLVAVASHGAPVWTSLREGRADRSELLADVAVLDGIGIVVALAVTLIIHRAFIANRAEAPPLRTTLLHALPITAVALAFLGLVAIARTDLYPEVTGPMWRLYASCTPGEPCPGAGGVDDRSARNDLRDRGGNGEDVRGVDRLEGLGLSGAGNAQTAAESPEDGEPDSNENGPDLSALGRMLLIALGAVAAAIVGALLWVWYKNRSARRERSPGNDEERPEPDAEATQGAAASTIDIEAMLADPDPNTAIIGAYARLLEDLAACDSRRRVHEAPMEHAQRVLAAVPMHPKPVRQLIGLFEIARFSTHSLTAAHRDQALAALRAAAADIALVPASRRVGAGSRHPRFRAAT